MLGRDAAVCETDAMGGGQRASDRNQHAQRGGRRQRPASGQPCREVHSVDPRVYEKDRLVGIADRLHGQRVRMPQRSGEFGRVNEP